MLNPFFLQGSKSEQGLIQDLINEQLRMYGVEVHYLPRQYVTEKTIIKEVIESEFKGAFPIEAYVDTYEGYSGQGTLLSKFGVQELDDLTIIVSRERWENYIQPLIQNYPDVKLSKRPKEGDLIYFPLGDRLFEIKYVEHEKPFYQLQGLYTYELRCELFRYEDEVIDTGVDYIDDNVAQDANIQTLQLIGIGTTATAVASIVNGGVRYVTITNRGNNYTSAPNVAFSTAPSGGVTAVGIATLLSGIVDICGPDETKYRVQGVELTNPGSGYTVAPKVAFIGGGGSGATAIPLIGAISGSTGSIIGAKITDGGSGYRFPPFVEIRDNCNQGYGAVARATINDAGEVDSIYIVSEGENYPTGDLYDNSVSTTADTVINSSTDNQTQSLIARNYSINKIIIQNPGQNYIGGDGGVGGDTATDQFGNEYSIEIFEGSITKIQPINTTVIVNDLPIITIKSDTGSGAILRPILDIPPAEFQGEVRQVIDCVT